MYLGPLGIQARAIWKMNGRGRAGEGIGLVDIEQGWNRHHEDLALPPEALISGESLQYPDHGTAVFSVVAAIDNSVGGTGIASGNRSIPDRFNLADKIRWTKPLTRQPRSDEGARWFGA